MTEDEKIKLQNRALVAEAKWQDYEREYILPAFEWAKEVNFDLPAAVKEAKGNCIERLVRHLIETIQHGASTERPPLTHVACKDIGGRVWSLPAPLRHHHVLRVMYAHGAKQAEDNHYNQGFLDANGRYLHRKAALVNAELNNQIRNGKLIGGILTSEDLW